MTEPTSPLLIDAALDKSFAGRAALRGAALQIRPGTVHALVGENGAGKSTLVRIVAGVLRGDAGRLRVAGRDVEVARWTRPQARAAGIGIVQQHGAFAPTLSVVENAVLGVEPRAGALLALRPTADALARLGERTGLPIDPWARVGALSLGAAQRAEIVAALHHGARLLVLDEPTAVLAPVEVDGLLSTLRGLTAGGTTVLIVTHKLDEVRAFADEVTVLRQGQTVATFAASGGEGPRLDVRAIARAMVGSDEASARLLHALGTAPAGPRAGRAPDADASPALVMDRLSVDGALHEVSLAVRAGELVGVAGVDGNGQRELALAIAGLVRHTGTVSIRARDVSRAAPAGRLAAGLAHIPEDRHHGGLVLDATVAENLTLGRRDVTGTFVVDRGRVAQMARDQVAALDIRPPDPHAVVRALSGGNQQKVVVARELSRPALAAVVASQPTRGVDLGAVARIHDQLEATARAGAGVLVISADLDELLAICHRVVVLLRGRIAGELAGDALHTSQARATLGAMMTGAGAAA